MPALHWRSEEHTSELQSRPQLVCRLLLEKKKNGVDPQAAELHVSLVEDRVGHLFRRQHEPEDVGDLLRGEGAHRHPHVFVAFFFNDTATTEIYTLSLHDALPI